MLTSLRSPVFIIGAVVVVALTLDDTALAQQDRAGSSRGLSIFDVSVSARSFNPMRGDKVELRYTLSRGALVTVKVFDPDLELVRVLAEKASRPAGVQRVSWDGKDLQDKIVPNEAYLFTIEASDQSGGTVVYDPVTFSGGEPFDLSKAEFNRETGTLVYSLSQPSRVLVRAGIPGSALLKTLVDWGPRIAGEITEYWNGKDEDNVIDVAGNPKYTILITYFTLPDTSVITIGNSKDDYRTYKRSLTSARPKKEERPQRNTRKRSPHFLASRLTDRSFKVTISFPELEKRARDATPTVAKKAMLRVDVAGEDREVILGRQFEIILFVDTVYLAEEERGYVPFNIPWEVGQLPPGEHVVTVNIVTFDDQIGVGSTRVRITK